MWRLPLSACKSLQCSFRHQCRSTEISMFLWAARIHWYVYVFEARHSQVTLQRNVWQGMEMAMYPAICFQSKRFARYMEISMYLTIYVSLQGTGKFPCTMSYVSSQDTYMEISMYPTICFISRYMEISMYLAKVTYVSLQGTWKFLYTLPNVCMWGKLLARYMVVSMFPASFAFQMRYLWKSCSLRQLLPHEVTFGQHLTCSLEILPALICLWPPLVRISLKWLTIGKKICISEYPEWRAQTRAGS